MHARARGGGGRGWCKRDQVGGLCARSPAVAGRGTKEASGAGAGTDRRDTSNRTCIGICRISRAGQAGGARSWRRVLSLGGSMKGPR